MRKKQRFWVFVDVDGTVIDPNTLEPRPCLVPFLQGIHELGGRVVLWSGGGVDYVRRTVRNLMRQGFPLDGLINDTRDKTVWGDLVGPKFFVDDWPENLDAMLGKAAATVVDGPPPNRHIVKSFIAKHMRADRELLAALEGIRVFSSSLYEKIVLPSAEALV